MRARIDFEDLPSWRESEVETTTSERVKEISTYREQYESLPHKVRKFCEDDFARAMTIDTIYHLNIGELVGTQTMDCTKAVLESLMQRRNEGSSGSELEKMQEERETINTYKAMNHLHEVIHTEMMKTGLLTVQQICDVHKVLLSGLHKKAGELRQTEVFTNWHGGIHYYPHPRVAAQKIYSIIDQHNFHMDSRPETTFEDTAFIFKCAAWLLFNFVDTHPFADGNGRMCRLLANYVVSLITPFPVSLYHRKHPHRSGREDYINAIVCCRDHPDEGPQELAAMLVEGAWQGWRYLFSNLQRRQEMNGETGDIEWLLEGFGCT